jgi:peptidoglycan/xylan/chitin deacetylase (PgdA/CDA1 family)
MAKEVPLHLKGWSDGIRLPFLLTFEHNSGEAAPNRPGDRPNANYFGQMEYGGRRGAWNILEMLESLGIKATFFVSGNTAERFPDTVRAAKDAGHEIAAMGYSFEKVRTVSPEREKAIVRRSVKAIKDVCGAEIKGWRTPDYRISPQTFDVLSAEGFVWDSSMLNDDLPYQLQCKDGKSLIEIPFTTTTSEKSHVAFPYPMRGGPSGVASVLNNEFDILYRESANEPRFLILSLQTWAAGRPTPLRTLKTFLTRVIAHNDVKFTQCSDMAEWCGRSAASKH